MHTLTRQLFWLQLWSLYKLIWSNRIIWSQHVFGVMWVAYGQIVQTSSNYLNIVKCKLIQSLFCFQTEKTGRKLIDNSVFTSKTTCYMCHLCSFCSTLFPNKVQSMIFCCKHQENTGHFSLTSILFLTFNTGNWMRCTRSKMADKTCGSKDQNCWFSPTSFKVAQWPFMENLVWVSLMIIVIEMYMVISSHGVDMQCIGFFSCDIERSFSNL